MLGWLAIAVQHETIAVVRHPRQVGSVFVEEQDHFFFLSPAAILFFTILFCIFGDFVAGCRTMPRPLFAIGFLPAWSFSSVVPTVFPTDWPIA
jgi:hypothetical protein